MGLSGILYQKIEEVVSIERCQAIDEGRLWRWPCGLTIDKRTASRASGVGWYCIKVIHGEHHELGHEVKEWSVVESSDYFHSGRGVRLSYSCDCKGGT